MPEFIPPRLMSFSEFMSENPPLNISDDLFQLLTDSGDPHNLLGFFAWVQTNDETQLQMQSWIFEKGVAYLSRLKPYEITGRPTVGYQPARWSDELSSWEAIPGAALVTEDEPGVVHTMSGGYDYVEDDGSDGHHPGPEWTIVRGPKGVKAFEQAATFLGWELKFNEMSKTASMRGVEIDDSTIAKVRYTLEIGVSLAIPTTNGTVYKPFVTTQRQVSEWLTEVGLMTGSYHPLQDYLAGLPAWDETPRIDGLLDLVLGATVEGDTRQGDLARIASSNIVMQLVNRAMEPGCAWPLMTILWGPQGIGKTQFLALLMPPDSDMHYESATFPLSDEELFDYTRNSWLVEFSDPSTRRAESESAKTFLSRNLYVYRHKYAHMSTKHPYNFGMVATGNPDGNTVIPPDASGYRRYLSVDCVKKFEYPELKALMDSIRNQIWAEAIHRYKLGEQYREIPRVLQPIRDAAAGAKAGSEHLEGFTEYVADKLEKDANHQATGVVFRDPTKGYSMDELVQGFLQADAMYSLDNTVSVHQIVNFRRQNSAQLTACLKELGMVNRKVTKKKVSRWFRGE